MKEKKKRIFFFFMLTLEQIRVRNEISRNVAPPNETNETFDVIPQLH